MAARNLIAIVAGVGAGTGACVARKFAQAYPVVLLARKPENYDPTVEEIKKAGGKAIGISTDVASSDSVKAAISQIQKEFGSDVAIAAAIFNASGPFQRKPFLEAKEEEFKASVNVSLNGAFIFSQAVIPLLQKAKDGQYPPTLIFTGATASVKSNAQMYSFSTGKFALRALATSLAKEFGPQGIHVSHAVIDGVIDIPRTKDWMQGAAEDAKIKPEAIADSYWYLHTQHRSCFIHEIDIRPYVEKWDSVDGNTRPVRSKQGEASPHL